STITQQYVKNALLSDDETLSRKLEEAALSMEIERTYSKERIMELYLNTVYFGNGASGIEAAANTYFGVSSSGLNLTQAAMLAGIVQSPSIHDPYENPEDAKKRRDTVIQAMLDEGYINPQTAETAEETPLGVIPKGDRPGEAAYPAGHFVSEVREWFLDNPEFGTTRAERAELLYGGGLRIYTTIDLNTQAQAEAAVNKFLPNPGFQGDPNDFSHDPDAALVTVEPRTGYIRAMVGGKDYFGDTDYAKVNLAAGKGHPTGSSFKGITLATALKQGIEADDRFPSPGQACFSGWCPSGGGGLGGSAKLEDCAAFSSNTCFAYLASKVLGPQKIRETAYDLGISQDKLKERDGSVNATITLGTYDTSVQEMASAYSTFANRGIRVDPVLVTRITKADGSVVFQNQHRQRKVLEPEIAYEESRILTGVITKGTGKDNANIGRPEAGKTGTVELKSGANSDAWFVGYTPDLATAVWVGYAQRVKAPDGTPLRPKDLGSVQGGKVPAQIWADFMKTALAFSPPTPFTQPVPKQTAPTIPEVRQFEPVEPPDIVQMPDVRGRGREDALARLEELGLKVTSRELKEDPQNEPGEVVNQSPLPGRALTQGAQVTIESAPGTQAVPSLLGLSDSDAKAALKRAGLEVKEAASPAPEGTVGPDGEPVGPGTVWSQTPAPGEAPPEDKIVEIRVVPQPGEAPTTTGPPAEG
ncbi:MAG: transglycosylase domain-containing protein, partial [Microthrixaceae bacterium]|nr:transglycosylase domain-containing protein [Microthrixaceae bacterium]